MQRYLIFGVVGMSALAAVIGFRAGSLQWTETEAIQAVAEIWVAQGGVETDCAAIPGTTSWLAVHCGGATGTQSWQVSVNGQITAMKDEA